MGRYKNFNEADVLDKAIVIFQKQGFGTTTPDELVKYLGISKSSLYSTFGDKYGLLIHALKRYRELSRSALQTIISENKDPLTGIEKIFEVSVAGCYRPGVPSGCFMVNSIIEFGPDEKEASKIVKDSYDDCRNAFLHYIRLAKSNKAKISLTEQEAFADYLMNAVAGIVVSAKAGMLKRAAENVMRQTLLPISQKLKPVK